MSDEVAGRLQDGALIQFHVLGTALWQQHAQLLDAVVDVVAAAALDHVVDVLLAAVPIVRVAAATAHASAENAELVAAAVRIAAAAAANARRAGR